MSKMFLFSATIGLALALSGQASADPKPAGAKPPAAQDIANLYAGRTDIWRTCDGGIYYGGAWEAQATCTRKGESVGLGKWSVTRDGSICWELTWYWPDGDGVGSKVDDKSCIRHLVDANGVIWRKWESDPEWWRFKAEENKGFKFRRPINKLRRKLNV